MQITADARLRGVASNPGSPRRQKNLTCVEFVSMKIFVYCLRNWNQGKTSGMMLPERRKGLLMGPWVRPRTLNKHLLLFFQTESIFTSKLFEVKTPSLITHSSSLNTTLRVRTRRENTASGRWMQMSSSGRRRVTRLITWSLKVPQDPENRASVEWNVDRFYFKTRSETGIMINYAQTHAEWIMLFI